MTTPTPTLDQILNPRRVVAYFDFNTGRLYSEQGQHISVTAYSDGLIAFMDRTRMIDGVISLEKPLSNPSYRILESIVMHRYDRNQYDPGTIEDYDRIKKAQRCGHFSLKRDSTTTPNFLCLDCGTLLSADSVHEASMDTLRSVK